MQNLTRAITLEDMDHSDCIGYAVREAAICAYAADRSICMIEAALRLGREIEPRAVCSICGAEGSAAYLADGDGAHHLCNARAKRGLPTPPLHDEFKSMDHVTWPTTRTDAKAEGRTDG